MKTFIILLFCCQAALFSQQWIRINQLGFTPDSKKVAVLVCKNQRSSPSSFTVRNALTDDIVYRSFDLKSYSSYGPFESTFRLDFCDFSKIGTFYIQIDSVRSPLFKISESVYNGSADFLLNYMRQQRSGYNPYLKDSCHTNDGFIIYHPTLDSTHIDASGGWHDASDYLQYVTTSATATYQMMFAYQQNPRAFNDLYDKHGNPGSNGIPDILDEAKWGLDWLVKMNPQPEMFFNQIADDRDHRGFRLPTEDTVYYGKGKERPVYFIDGKPQGIYQNKNRTTGVASTVAKFSSSFALGSELLKHYYPDFSLLLKKKSAEAYEFAKKYPGVSQTAPCGAPYFYEEENWVDDMQLASAQLYNNTRSDNYLADAVHYGNQEPTTPWLGADTARHYEWFPFVNLGHYLVAKNSKADSKQFIAHLRKGIEKVYQRGKSNAFQFGIPFIWCSNNLVSSFLTQLYLYRTLTHDNSYIEMESSLRDWLFGCNPWATSMIYGLPAYGDTPTDPHSAFTHVHNFPINGGLIDGPVKSSIFNQHKKYIRLTKADPYAEFQSDLAVYHDDWGDYTNNEPTMDGTASLTMYLSSLESKKRNSHTEQLPMSSTEMRRSMTSYGGITRFDTRKKEIYLVFTGHEFAEGGNIILKTLQKHKIKASFFFTGDFYRTKKFSSLIKQIKTNGHYLGAHSDKHLLYASWEKRDSLLVDKTVFTEDLKNNYKEMKKFGIISSVAQFFLPPYEWYNQTISNWTNELGLELVNFTPGTSSNADYTTPDMANYVSSDSIVTRILRYESNSSNGLNGFLLLSHIGTSEKRTDKFYKKLDGLIAELKKRGYRFSRL
ncbi:MAG TPA: cellulase [Bacteroidetes bacterium]|nr:cellulase [Bacteroidota bacterium]